MKVVGLAMRIEEIAQTDNFHILINWSDGLCSHCRLATLQAHCPCVRCACSVDRIKIAQRLQAYSIETVGSYALKFRFTSGCSNGIYPFSLLRKLGSAHE